MVCSLPCEQRSLPRKIGKRKGPLLTSLTFFVEHALDSNVTQASALLSNCIKFDTTLFPRGEHKNYRICRESLKLKRGKFLNNNWAKLTDKQFPMSSRKRQMYLYHSQNETRTLTGALSDYRLHGRLHF